MKAATTCLQELSFHIQGGSEEGREHSTGVPGALKCSLAPSRSWEPSPCVSVGVSSMSMTSWNGGSVLKREVLG